MTSRPNVPRIKICGLALQEDVASVAAAGADAAGFLVGLDYPSEDALEPDAAANLIRRVPSHVTPVLVTHASRPARLAELAERVRPRAVQIHGGFAPADLPALKAAFPDIAWIRAVHPEEGDGIDGARRAAEVFDAILLDSRSGDRLGGTGKTHDWRISRAIREAVDAPVILAGGLTPGNVAGAIRTVRPHGVDVNTGVSERRGVKAAAKVAAFVRNARAALDA